MPTIDFIRGVGKYEDALAVNLAFETNMPENYYQIHGHRNIEDLPIKATERCFNLEGQIETGGHLRVVTLDENGFETHEILNEVFDTQTTVDSNNYEVITEEMMFNLMQDNHLVAEKKSKKYPISAFNFKPMVFKGRLWDNQTIKARGLFFKNETKKIEQYNDEESKIKTNVGQVEHGENFSNINIGQGGPVNTADILEQLKKMKENLQKQIENKPKIDVEVQENEQKNESEQLNQEDEKENKVADENNNNKIEDNKIENIEDSEKKLEEEKQNIEGILPVETKQNVEETVVTETKPEEKLEEIKEQIKKLENINYEETTPQDFNTMYEKLFGRKPIENEQLPEEQPKENKNTAVDLIKDNISVFEQREEYKKPIYKFIGIAFNTYIIIEMDKEMYIIDQHAAHERIMYEKVKKNYYSEYSKDSQMLLLPDVITLTHKEMEIAKDNMDLFKNAGFSLEEFGENTIKLTGVPTVCLDIDNKELFLETLDEINTIARTAKQEKEERFIATVACKAAVKANMVLDKAEVENLMDKLLELPNPFTCPHGRPTAIKMSKYDIERKFARK